jgi:hypothetical protein
LGNDTVSLSGFKLHDDRGVTNADAYTFPYYIFLYPTRMGVFCRGDDFQFDIDSNDTITLLDSNGNLISTTGVLPNEGNATLTYQRTTNNTYMYGRPTPYRDNFAIFEGSVYINEVASTPTINACFYFGNYDWIEIINTGNETVSLVGFILHDDRGPTNIESFLFTYSSLDPDEILIVCGYSTSSSDALKFDVDSNDTITLLDFNGQIISTTGPLLNGGNATSTYQRTNNNTYMYRRPTFRFENFPIYIGNIFINEVAISPTPGFGVCLDETWIELFNAGNKRYELNGFVLHDDRGPSSNESFTIDNDIMLYPGQFKVICGQPPYFIFRNNFLFIIDNNDTITLRDYYGNVISTTGVLPDGGNATSTYQRTTNNTYMYGLPTPNRKNIMISTPSSIPTETPPIPITVPISIPTGRLPIPVPAPNPAFNCGLFGLNFFCLGRNQCGFWRRLLNLRGC